MKYIMLGFMLLVSISAFTANQNKTATTEVTDSKSTQLDDLMRGEIAALRAYDVALKDIKDEDQKSKLEAIRDNHEKALSKMSKWVSDKPDLLEKTSKAGPWGTFAETWTKTRKLTGNSGALKALRQGEKHGIKKYEDALNDESISDELKNVIKAELLPNQKKHIETLNTIL